MITAELLKRIPLFAGIPEDERTSLAARSADVRLNAERVADPRGPDAVVLSRCSRAGWRCSRTSADATSSSRSYEPGDYFGEVPLLLASPAVASVRAVEPARVARLDPADFHDLITHCKVLNSEIMKTMGRRVGALQQMVADTPLPATMIIGRQHDVACLELREFLARNGRRVAWRDLDDSDGVARLVFDGVVASADEAARTFDGTALPLVILGDGTRLEAPSFREARRRARPADGPAIRQRTTS